VKKKFLKLKFGATKKNSINLPFNSNTYIYSCKKLLK